tara:strand:- start:3590 stop:4363 length:774 start_codon:yes stop_codon:yes gene_type:complete
MSDDDCMPKIDKVLIAKIDADEREKCANDNEEEIVLEKSVEPREHNEMFKGGKPVSLQNPSTTEIAEPIKIEIIKKEEVVEEVPDIRDEIKIEKKKIKKPKKLYPHLEKARAKAKENRAKRKAEKDKLKKETKEQKKEARKEKQREIARNHYWEKKAKAETETETEIVNKPQFEDIRTATANGMSYDKFSSFMDKYNLEKMTAYEKRKAKREEAEKVVKAKDETIERKKRLSRNMVSRQNIRGMYVDGGEDYSDFFF